MTAFVTLSNLRFSRFASMARERLHRPAVTSTSPSGNQGALIDTLACVWAAVLRFVDR